MSVKVEDIKKGAKFVMAENDGMARKGDIVRVVDVGYVGLQRVVVIIERLRAKHKASKAGVWMSSLDYLIQPGTTHKTAPVFVTSANIKVGSHVKVVRAYSSDPECPLQVGDVVEVSYLGPGDAYYEVRTARMAIRESRWRYDGRFSLDIPDRNCILTDEPLTIDAPASSSTAGQPFKKGDKVRMLTEAGCGGWHKGDIKEVLEVSNDGTIKIEKSGGCGEAEYHWVPIQDVEPVSIPKVIFDKVHHRLYTWRTFGHLYKLQQVKGAWYWVSMDNSTYGATTVYKSAQEAIDAKTNVMVWEDLAALIKHLTS